jgi:hypothetical protein
MELEMRKRGELVAAVGVVLGLVALWMRLWDEWPGKYSTDGTVTIAMSILLGLAACCLLTSLLGFADLDLIAAASGAVAFGFFLDYPARAAFDQFGALGTGAWLGICAGLIPLGAGFAHFTARKRSSGRESTANPATVLAAIGLVMIVAGIGMTTAYGPASPGNPSYWNISSSGHALGLLLLLLAIASALLIAGAVSSPSGRSLADLALIVSSITAGLAMSEGIRAAFHYLGWMGSGAWMELFGGLALLFGLIGTRVLIFAPLRKAAEE